MAWKKDEIKIATQIGSKDAEYRPVEAWVNDKYPLLAVTLGLGETKRWTVTHIPTGLMAAGFTRNVTKAKKHLVRLYPVFNWETITRETADKEYRNLSEEARHIMEDGTHMDTAY